MDLLNAIVALTNFVIVPAVSYGSQLALGALGVTLIYGILRFSNFAHGDTMAFGAMVTILFTWWFQGMGLTLGPLPTALLALPFGIAVTALLLIGTDRVVYRFYREQKAKPVILVIVSLGVMFIMNACIGMITPPVGIVLNVVSGVARVPMGQVIRGISPFLVAQITLLFILIAFPELVLVPLSVLR
jgi:branched-chain amino acid transport system permease protein